MRRAATDGFLPGLSGSRETHFEDLHICVEDQRRETKENRESVDQSVDVAGCATTAQQLCNSIIDTVNSVDNVSTQHGGGIQGYHHSYVKQRKKP